MLGVLARWLAAGRQVWVGSKSIGPRTSGRPRTMRISHPEVSIVL